MEVLIEADGDTNNVSGSFPLSHIYVEIPDTGEEHDGGEKGVGVRILEGLDKGLRLGEYCIT